MRNLLVAVDFSDVTDRVIEVAVDMARGLSGKVWLLHCVSQYPSIAAMSDVPMTLPVPDSELPDSFPAKHGQLSNLIASIRAKGVDAEMLFVSGSARDEILSAAGRYHIDMIVMGSHGHGALYDLVVGSVAKSVLQSTGIPTLIVPHQAIKEKVTHTESQWEEPLATPY